MKTLLWISRHGYNKAQIDHIVNKIGAVEVITCNEPNKEDIKKQILAIKPDCIVGIIPVPWISYLLKGVPKSTIWLKIKCKTVHPGEHREEPCAEFDISRDILIEPSQKRWDDYITKGDKVIHLRHSGYERIIQSREQLLFINWK
jgi:hypothetical protein